jgi:hypothetical protein
MEKIRHIHNLVVVFFLGGVCFVGNYDSFGEFLEVLSFFSANYNLKKQGVCDKIFFYSKYFSQKKGETFPPKKKPLARIR